MMARCRSVFLLLLLPLLGATSACRNKTDVLETELRSREMMYREALEEQRRAEAQIIALHRENEALRHGSKITPEQAAQTFGLKRITLGRATGAFDHDNLPGDEVLQVVVEPRDQSDHVIKAPGSLSISTLEITPSGVKTPLWSWDISTEKTRNSWKQGLLGNGYTLTLPWQNFPTTEHVRVVVRFITSDQRVFETDKDIKVRPVPGAAQKRMEFVPEAAPMVMPEAGPFLFPASRVKTSSSPLPTQWHSAPPSSVTLDRPQPIE